MSGLQNSTAREQKRASSVAKKGGQISIEVAACLYVAALLLGGLALFSIFSFPHSGLLLVASVAAAAVALAAVAYSIRSVVDTVMSLRAKAR